MINSQSKYYDTKSGLYYYYHRYYDPKTGRFITEDPIKSDFNNNLYLFAGNDSINFKDPLGLSGIYVGCKYIGKIRIGGFFYHSGQKKPVSEWSLISSHTEGPEYPYGGFIILKCLWEREIILKIKTIWINYYLEIWHCCVGGLKPVINYERRESEGSETLRKERVGTEMAVDIFTNIRNPFFLNCNNIIPK